MEGFIQLHKKLLESYVFVNEKDLKIWIWLLLKARYKAGYVEINVGKGKRTIKLKRGQLIYGRHKAEQALKIPGTTIGRHLEKMKDENMINIEVDSLYSIITICNYDSYQQVDSKSGQVTDSQRTGNGQVTDTKNKDNKDNKEEVGGGEPPSPKKTILEKQEEMKLREKDFYQTLIPFVEQYGKEMIRAFYEYWKEPNKSKTKMKFEMEETWDIKSRLNRWETNNHKFGKAGKPVKDQEKELMKSLGL